MRTAILFLLLTLLPALGRVHESFNEGWKFHKGAAEGAEVAAYDDAEWRSLNLPHDWAIEGPFSVEYNARCGGLPFHGTGWYRKTFEAPQEWDGKRVAITFDGAMYNAHVWVNGEFLGNRPFGYMGFQFDLSSHLNYGEKNTIAVRLQPEDLSSRWYPGAGLYRNTWLTVTEKAHIPLWGVEISTPEVAEKSATVKVVVHLRNESEEQLSDSLALTISNPGGSEVAEVIQSVVLNAGEQREVTTSILLPDPKLWDLESPHLYTLRSKLGDKDEVTETFGVRTVDYIPGEGMYLNGKLTKIKGVCLHHDHGPLGAAVSYRATERQLEIMKEMGANSIRTAHNPPSPEQLELCDKMGILVQVEAFDCWKIGKVENGYNKFWDEWHERDLRDMIKRDRNHPSVIMWSIGNEILEQGQEDGWKLARHLHEICKDEDPTRLTSAGFNWYPTAIENGLAAEVDVPGFNYKPMAYGEVSSAHPDWNILGSETSSCTSSRGVYHLPLEKYEKHPSLQVTSYDLIGPVWAYPPDVEFMQLKKNPNVLGEYIWTGQDYLGEPTPYGGRDNSTNGYWNDDWPSRSSYFGAVDLCGLPKDRFYLYQSEWTSVEENPMVHVLPHWNWLESEETQIPVYAYTNGDEVELFLNGKSLGRKKKGTDLADVIVNFKWWPGFKEGQPEPFQSPYRLRWDVAYEPGELKVIAYHNGKVIAEDVRETAGAPAKIQLTADRQTISFEGNDISYVTVSILDANGVLCPRADNLVQFEIDGPGEIAAVGNGDATATTSFQAKERKAFSGKCMVIVKGSEDFTLKASGEGLESEAIKISVE